MASAHPQRRLHVCFSALQSGEIQTFLTRKKKQTIFNIFLLVVYEMAEWGAQVKVNMGGMPRNPLLNYNGDSLCIKIIFHKDKKLIRRCWDGANVGALPGSAAILMRQCQSSLEDGEAAQKGFRFSVINFCYLMHKTSFQLLFSCLEDTFRYFLCSFIQTNLLVCKYIPNYCA